MTSQWWNKPWMSSNSSATADNFDNFWPRTLTILTISDHELWQFWPFLTTNFDNFDYFWPPTLTILTISDHQLWQFWLFLTTNFDNFDHFWPRTLTILTISDHQLWQFWLFLTTNFDNFDQSPRAPFEARIASSQLCQTILRGFHRWLTI